MEIKINWNNTRKYGNEILRSLGSLLMNSLPSENESENSLPSENDL